MTRQWSKFYSLKSNEDKSWRDNSEYVIEDLSYLLELEASEFWNIVNDSSCNDLLDSCLIHLPRSHEEASKYNHHDLKSTLDQIYRRVFFVFLRLSTYKEKPFNSPEEFGKTIYNNFLISLPQIFDLVSLFPKENRSLLKGMLENIFKHQPNYLKNDLPVAIELMFQMMGKDTEEASALDTFRSVYYFLSLYPKGSKVFYEKDFHSKSSEYYSQHLSKKSSKTGKLARHYLLGSVRLIIENTFLQPENLSVESFQEYQDLFLHLIPEENFILDYDTKYPVSSDIQLFTSQNPGVDLQGVDYILEGLSKGRNSLTERVIQRSAVVNEARGEAETTSSSVSMVKEAMPELGGGFIKACLEHYEGDPGRVINALFESSLPSHLQEMDRSKDEWIADVKNKTKATSILDDRSFMNDENMKSFYQMRGLVSDVVVSMQGDEEGNDYDDEYDDTYDDACYGPEDPDPLTERRAFVLPRALGGGHVGRKETDGGDEESSEEDENRMKPHNFCRNPQEVREERERKRLAKHRGGASGGGGAGGGFGNVVGNKKGQGQDKSVLINRARKNASKNKGQRTGADRKMAKGMF
eukprot:TRINITY_DN8534_c0_g1_i1.p1 TRINITY_DN8534_c0_g1~~TRINITY_DN8534_c0_g1_i1.p1  ORF type:complete len:581 (-),score=160.06 TRINITY_DN8534_c0_g1_i1:25-1767(-)